MALAIDGSSPAAVTGTTQNVTTASFTPPSGSLVLILFVVNDPSTADASIVSVTNTGTAITWTRRARKNRNASSDGGVGQEGGAEIWSGVGAGSAVTVSVNSLPGSTGAGHEKLFKAMVLTDADTTALTNIAAAQSNSGLPSVAVAGCAAGSYVFAVSSDWTQAGLGTAGSGQTIISESNVAGQMTMHTWRTTAVLAGAGSQTMNLTAPAAQDYNLAAIEIRDVTGGGAPAIPPILALPNRARITRSANW